MRTILFIVRKEFLQIFRHRIMLSLIFVVPIVQLLILANAADYEIKNIALHVIDRDASTASRRLCAKFQASKHFRIENLSFAPKAGYADIAAGRADLFLEIPRNFERDLWREGRGEVQLTIDAINGTKAGLANSYAQAIIRDFNREILSERGAASDSPRGLEIAFSNWYNPDLEYHHFMVPGILVILVTLVGMFLCGMNIVKEREVGTIDQLNVTPIKKHHFIIGKLLPFWIIAIAELSFGLAIGKLVFDIPMVGHLGLVFGFAALYLLVVLGMGLLLSTFSHTQQQAMFIAWFILIIWILLSGLFTPVESMPEWARQGTKWLNPISHFVQVIRMLLLKGSGAAEIRHHIYFILVFALVVNAFAVLNYRKQAA